MPRHEGTIVACKESDCTGDFLRTPASSERIALVQSSFINPLLGAGSRLHFHSWAKDEP